MRGAVAGVVAAALLGLAADAQACSFMAPDAAAYLEKYDAAFVGTLVAKEERFSTGMRSTGDPATYVFDVESVYKGELPARVDVVAAAEGASCGLEVPGGQRIGVFLVRDGDTWRSSLPLQVAPAKLETAARTRGIVPHAPSAPAGGGRGTWTAAASVLVIAAALAALLLARRRRRDRPAASAV
jgi:hypothetical protein